MSIDYPAVLQIQQSGEVTWTARDTMLYALGLGMGDDPMDRAELPFVTEREGGPRPLPTMVTILTSTASPIRKTGANLLMAVHGEQAIRLHLPLPAAGVGRLSGRVTQVYDKGEGKGAVLMSETVLTNADTGDAIATASSTAFLRGDGGFGGPREGAAAPHSVPSRAPDRVIEIATRTGQALLYRLSGDYNAIHSDPDVAADAGFERPILHGLCTYGITARAVVRAFAENDAARLIAHAVRFSSPVLPGDTIAVSLWRDAGVISFEATVPARNVTVIKNGRAEVA